MFRAARHKGHTFAMVMGSRASPSSVRRSGIVNFDLLFNIIDDLDNQLNLLLEANAPRTDGKTGRVDPDWPATPSSAQLQERRRHQGNDYNKSGHLDVTIHKTLDGDKKTWRRHSAACSEQPGNSEGNAMRKTPAGNCNTNKGTPSETGTPRETGTPINSMTPRRRLSCNTTLTMESESSCTRRQHQHIPSVAFTAAIHPEMSTPAINGSSDRKWSIPSPKKLPTGCTQALRHLFMPPTCSSTPPTLSIIPSDMHAPQTTISGPIDIDGSLELNRSIQGYMQDASCSILFTQGILSPPATRGAAAYGCCQQDSGATKHQTHIQHHAAFHLQFRTPTPLQPTSCTLCTFSNIPLTLSNRLISTSTKISCHPASHLPPTPSYQPGNAMVRESLLPATIPHSS